MKVSIITAVYNNEETIKDAVESVLNQTYKDIEYIIVDGASSDATIEIIKSYGDKITKFISEKDKSIYDGLNKGIKMASGDIICFLHSDDLYATNNTVELVINEFNKFNVDGIYGDLVYTTKNDTTKVIRYWKSCDFDINLLSKGWMPAHPTLFLKREVYEKFGVFDLDFKIAADYDFMLRILKGGIKVKYLPKLLYKMRLGGESNNSIYNIMLKSKEDLKALRKNAVGGFVTLFLKNFSKIKQFMVKE